MARIRTIKPEFFTSADILKLSPLARLFYVSLWCEADREGLLKWDPETLKFRYLPKDQVSIDDLAEELEKAELIEIYEVDGKQYAAIPSFKTHQIINNREALSGIPARVKVACTRVQGEGKEGKGREGKGRKGTTACDEPQNGSTPEASELVDLQDLPMFADSEHPAHESPVLVDPVVVVMPLVGAQTFDVLQSHAAGWAEAYPRVDIVRQLAAMRQWCIANPTKRKTRKGVLAFCNAWLAKEQNSGGPVHAAQHAPQAGKFNFGATDRAGDGAAQAALMARRGLVIPEGEVDL